VTGIDSSAELLAAARRDHPGINFSKGNIATWAAAEPVDVAFANASLQWVGGHDALLPRLFDQVAPDGVLAVQMPRNHDFATHRLMRQVAAEGDWRDRLAGAREPSPVKSPEFYYDCLAPRSAGFTVWETNYIQVMEGPQAIIAWVARDRIAAVSRPLERARAAGLPRALRRAPRRGLPGASRRPDIAALPAPVIHRIQEALKKAAPPVPPSAQAEQRLNSARIVEDA
jgi:trans-aconitate 2-methyltransferase